MKGEAQDFVDYPGLALAYGQWSRDWARLAKLGAKALRILEKMDTKG